jgi:hypothetical protein
MFIPDRDWNWLAADKISESGDGTTTFLITDEDVVHSPGSNKYRTISFAELSSYGLDNFPLQVFSTQFHSDQQLNF